MTRYSMRTGTPASEPRTVPTSASPVSRRVSVQCSSASTSSDRRQATRLVVIPALSTGTHLTCMF